MRKGPCRTAFRFAQITAALIATCASCGCICRVTYEPILRHEFKPEPEARIVGGHLGRVIELADQLKLPHNTEKDRVFLSYQLRHELTSQLGSHDYRLIGWIEGSGNGYTSMDYLKNELAKKAASRGGNVLLITETGVNSVPFVYSTPGYSTTNVYGNTAYTHFQPGTSYAGTIRFPRASGAVLRYSPGFDSLARRALLMDNDACSKCDAELAALEPRGLPNKDWEQAVAAICERYLPRAPDSQPAIADQGQPASTQPVSGGLIAKVSSSVVTVKTDDGQGSGFCVQNARTILTAAHVIEGAGVITVETSRGERLSAVVVKTDKEADVAILIVNGSGGLEPLSLRPALPEVGEECFALGCPKGLNGTVTKGIVSAVRKNGTTQVVQTDAAISPGNSGGPLIDRMGQVIGLCDFKLLSKGAESLNFAVGVEAIRSILDH